MKYKPVLAILLAMFLSPDLYGWGGDVHRLIGRAAYELLDDTARAEVLGILGHPGPGDITAALDHACNWPDAVREQPEWNHTSSLHYVNIPRHTDRYDRERDCAEGRCVTEAILDYADRLGYPDLDPEKRWQAFAFVCHFVGDLHQPLHAGFQDDRGGNTVEVRYGGEAVNLHWFWDGVLVKERLDDEGRFIRQMADRGSEIAGADWPADSVVAWTEESHTLAANRAYPGQPDVSAEFADQSWAVMQERWAQAAGRLAQLLNAVLGENEVLP